MGNQLLTMRSLLCFLQISSLCPLLAVQCDDTLPGGDVCGANDYMWVADPDCCWKYYECDAGCVTHQECEKDFKFDVDMAWCTFPGDVDCGDRPCNDLTHCPPPPTTTTPTPDCTPEEQWHDCADSGAGYFPDEYNCRYYWHCDKGDFKREHVLCKDDEHGNHMMWDLTFNGCNYRDQTRCDGRPICDECNDPNTCEPTPTIPPDCYPEDQKISCKDYGPGFFPDENNCRAYWHCANANKEPEHIICPDDNQGNPEMFDLVFNGCNYASQTNCGNRPICDECNENCDSNAVDCGHDLDCSNKQDGYYADPFSCRKYWHCQRGAGEHVLCKDNLMYDPGHVWCDFPENVNCGNRPPCNECNEGCP